MKRLEGRRSFAIGLGCALALASGAWGGGAQALDTYSFTADVRQWCCNGPNFGTPMNPTQVLQTLPIGAKFTGKTGLASGTGGSLMIPAGNLAHMTSFVLEPHPNPSINFLVTMFSEYNDAGTFAAGAGPGSVGVCFNYSLNPNCTDPGSASDPANYNGLVTLVPGPNQYGGTMRMLGGIQTIVSFTAGPATNLVNVGGFAAGFGFSGAPRVAAANTGFYTPNTMYSQFGNSTMGSVMGIAGITGAQWTTGMAYVLATGQPGAIPQKSHTVTGSDNRTVNGAGNITLVTGWLGQRVGGAQFPHGTRLQMTLPEPGQMALIGAGVVMLASLFFAGRRREDR